MGPQLFHHPIADDRLFARVVEDVDLPKREEDFALQDLRTGFHIGYRKRWP
jgi:hypothetical protein